MLKTLFTSLLLGSSLFAQAQKLELGINGGIAPFHFTSYKICPRETYDFKLGNYSSVRANINFKRWQAGLALDRQRTKTYNTAVSLGSDYVSWVPNVYVNGLLRLRNGYFYSGMDAGMTFSRNNPIINPSEVFGGMAMTNVRYKGYQVGAQLGYTIRIWEDLKGNFEAAIRYSSDKPVDVPSPDRVQVTYPVSVGLRYEL